MQRMYNVSGTVLGNRGTSCEDRCYSCSGEGVGWASWGSLFTLPWTGFSEGLIGADLKTRFSLEDVAA